MSCGRNKEFIVTWHIYNYSFCNHESGEIIESPFFRTECLGGSEWKLHLVPRDVNKGKEIAQCFLKRYDKNGEILIDYYKIEMIDPTGMVLATAEGQEETFRPSFDSDSILEIETAKLDVQQWNENKLTIRCCMKSTDTRHQPAIGCEVRTDIGIESHNFKWEIDLPLIDTVSKEFFILDKTKLKIEILKSGYSSNDPIVIEISEIANDPPLRRLVSCTISLLDGSGTVIKSKCAVGFFKPDDVKNVWVFPSFLTRLDFENYSNKRKKAIFQFEFTVNNGMNLETPLTFQYSANADVLLSLQNDMRQLFLSKKHTDCKLKLRNTETKIELPVHKSILIARSPFFSRLFDQDMVESKTSVIEVTEDEQTMEAFLEYLYTGIVEKMNCDCAKNLLLVADKYQVPSLRDNCAVYLSTVLSITNVCEILEFADLIRHQKLKNAALEYIALHLKEIIQLPDWSTAVNKSELLKDILETMVQKP